MAWVSADNLPPNNGKSVLIRINDDNDLICIGKYSHSVGEWKIGNEYVSWDWISSFNCEMVVTQWMPIPNFN
ncbi:hypothetical protein TUMSATVNIG1_59670 (plasmid) [Vibrio nigripulchritudo]|uniref:hypothetical protein n=1 Tax=Vibrio nigripulchritudo TaxID=28173 RepID=UPI00190C5E61|nr:hypothetical protein [Vibrio nigripulchritudo]BCL73981.1 hypothetical protein VNTUMSATTG_59180 [Vibrio nigripulchritudo]BDU35358.1 hypothetical protein TUMSATVNIG1_59670 [Vibrio nigripulchritudo]